MAKSKGSPKTGGRQKGTPNKVTVEIKSLARAHAGAAVTELIRLATKAESEATRVAAIKELLDRGYGRSTQAMQVELGGMVDFQRMSDEELHEAIAEELAVIYGNDADGAPNGKARR